MLSGYSPIAGALDHPLWREDAPPTLVIEEVERVWAAIDERDDWAPFEQKVAEIRRLGGALVPPRNGEGDHA